MKHNLSLRNQDDAQSKENILKKSAIVGKTEFYKKKNFSNGTMKDVRMFV